MVAVMCGKLGRFVGNGNDWMNLKLLLKFRRTFELTYKVCNKNKTKKNNYKQINGFF